MKFADGSSMRNDFTNVVLNPVLGDDIFDAKLDPGITVVEPLRREFHLSDTQLGALTTVFTLLYAFASLPLGRLADSWSRRKLLAIGTAVWAGLTGLGFFGHRHAPFPEMPIA